MVALAILQLIVAVLSCPLMVIVGSGRVRVIDCSLTDDMLPLRTVTALMITGEEALLPTSNGVLYTVPEFAVGSEPLVV